MASCYHFYPRSPCGERPHGALGLQAHQGISIHALLAESDLLILPSRFTRSAFLSTLSLRRATRRDANIWHRRLYFYPRSPCGERPTYVFVITPTPWISIHALLAESDRSKPLSRQRPSKFLSTLSLRRATRRRPVYTAIDAFLSTLSLRRATTSLVVIGTNCVISIHALLAESDSTCQAPTPQCSAFLSTLSLRRATWTY